jgi:hypothetical protein
MNGAKKHNLFKAADISYESPENKIHLTSKPELYPTKSVHNDRHQETMSEQLGKQMNKTLTKYQAEGWTQS